MTTNPDSASTSPAYNFDALEEAIYEVVYSQQTRLKIFARAAELTAQSVERASPAKDAGEQDVPKYGRKAIGSPVGYIDVPQDSHSRFVRLNDLHGINHGTLVYPIPDPFLRKLRILLQVMINSAEPIVADDVVIGYKIKTGSLHKIIGFFADADEPLTVPVITPLASQPPQGEG